MGSTSPLWIVFRGAPASHAVGWVGWVAVVAVTAVCIGHRAPQGVVALAALVGGGVLALRYGTPLDAFRRFHLDDLEITVLGPGPRVRRVAWTDVFGLTQRRDALCLEGGDATVTMPLGSPEAREAWGAALMRVVPALAADLWLRLEDGEERLVPSLDPPTPILAWWGWAPAVVVLGLTPGAWGVAVVVLVAATERGIAWLRARRAAVILHPTGVSLRSSEGRCFVPWTDAIVTPIPQGLRVGPAGHDAACVQTSAPNFWPAAAAMVLRAQVGPISPGPVTFRVRVDGGGLSVVGEIDAVN